MYTDDSRISSLRAEIYESGISVERQIQVIFIFLWANLGNKGLKTMA